MATKSRRIPVVRASNKATTPNGPKVSRAIYPASTRPGPYLIPTKKNPQGVIVAESFLESQFLIAADLDPRVKQIDTQPLVVDLISGFSAPTEEALFDHITKHLLDPKQAWIWFPDIQILLHGDHQPTLAEVKPATVAQTDKVVSKQTAARVWAKQYGWGYVLLTDALLPETLATNLRALHAYLMEDVNAVVLETVKEALATYGELTTREVCQRTGCDPLDVFVLLAHGRLEADLMAAHLTQHKTVLRPATPSTLAILPLTSPTNH